MKLVPVISNLVGEFITIVEYSGFMDYSIQKGSVEVGGTLELTLTDGVLEIKSDPNNSKLAIVFKGFKENGITVKHIE